MITKRKLFKELKKTQEENEKLRFEVSVLHTMYENLFQKYLKDASPKSGD